MGDGVLFAMCFAEAGIKIAESLGVEAHRPEGYSTHGNRPDGTWMPSFMETSASGESDSEGHDDR
jgi:hypothetical protein